MVAPAVVVPFAVEAALTLSDGPAPELVLAAARSALDLALVGARRIGAPVPVSVLYAALHRPGVEIVTLAQPAGSVPIGPGEVGFCTSVTIESRHDTFARKPHPHRDRHR